MKKLLFIAFIGLTLVACNKNQKAIKTLDGTWNATSWTDTDGAFSIDYIAAGAKFNIKFSNCKLKDDTYCDVVSTTTIDEESETESAQYRVTSDGTKLQIISDNGSIDQWVIGELTKTDLEVSRVDDDVTTNITLTKE